MKMCKSIRLLPSIIASTREAVREHQREVEFLNMADG